MMAAGYGYILHKNYRYRCATFYKHNKFTLSDTSHKNRALLTTFKMNPVLSEDRNIDEVPFSPLVAVANCHLR